MGSIKVDAPWTAYEGPSNARRLLGGGHEPNGTRQYVCRQRSTGVIGKLINGRGHVPVNGKEVVLDAPGLDVIALLGLGREPGWKPWSDTVSKDVVVASGREFSNPVKVSDGDDPVWSSADEVAPVYIAAFEYNGGLHIGNAWFQPELRTSFSWGGGEVRGQRPAFVVVWIKAKPVIHGGGIPPLHQ